VHHCLKQWLGAYYTLGNTSSSTFYKSALELFPGKAFPEFNTDMMVRFLEHFQFCHQVNKHWTKLVQSPEEGMDDEYYFFPALTSSEKPIKMPPESSYYCGWFDAFINKA